MPSLVTVAGGATAAVLILLEGPDRAASVDGRLVAIENDLSPLGQSSTEFSESRRKLHFGLVLQTMAHIHDTYGRKTLDMKPQGDLYQRVCIFNHTYFLFQHTKLF